MKKSLKLAVAASVLATPAMAANLENPLYMPTSGEFYSKTTAGLMLKVADSSDAHIAKGHDGATEFPIWRVQEDLGIGITDRIAIRGAFQYTYDGDIDRQGMNHGRLGLIWRAIETSDDIVLDVYADAHLGGINKMRGSFDFTNQVFNYNNYSNGRWGVDAGVRFGKTWSKLTTSAFVEVLQTFGSSNNVIGISDPALAAAGVPEEISVDLKSTTEVNFGLNAFYQLDDRWSFGAGFKYNHHADNGVKGLATDIDWVDGYVTLVKPRVDGLIASLADMDDGFDEYIITLSAANQITDNVQVAVYGEYTFDDAHAQSQNGTDVKAEVGVRLNLRF
jgi:hypothetical protein